VAADVFYNNPARSAIANAESPLPGAPDGKARPGDPSLNPDAASTVVEQGRAQAQPNRLTLERQQTERQRQDRDQQAVNATVPDMVFSEGDVRSSLGHRDGASTT